MKKGIVLIVIVLLVKTMSAADFSAICPSGQTLYYHIFSSLDKTVLVTYPGTNPGDYTGYERPTGVINFPAMVSYGGTTYTVIGIGSYAFGSCSGITGVDFSNTIASIGTSAFASCGITSLHLPESVRSVSSEAFKYNPLTSIVIDNPDISIGINAFYHTTWSNNHPDGVMYIGPVLYAYKGVAPENTTIQVMDNTRSIVARAFYQQRNIVSITFPNTIKNIGYEAFYGCNNLSSVTLPQSLQYIGYSCFENCGSLSQVNYNARDCYFSDDINSSNYGVFRGCENFSRLVIGNNVKTIPNYLFSGCNHLSGTLSIPLSVTKIEKFAFKDCDGITSVYIPKNMDTIGAGAFSGCYGLSVVYDAMNCINEGSYGSPFLYATNVSFGNNVQIIPERMFENCEQLSGLDIPNTVVAIGASAFSGCSGLSGNLIIPNSVTTIGAGAFSRCSGLSGSLVIPNSVTTIGSGAFSGCSGLSGNLVVPNSVITIGASAFSDCEGIVSVTIGTKVESIGQSAFNGMSSLETIDYNAVNATEAQSPFYFCNSLKILNVGQGVNRIPDFLMSACSSLEEIHLPSSLKSIGKKSFFQCTSLTSIVLPNSVESIDEMAFQQCSGLLSVEIPNSVRTIGNGAFEGCSGALKLTIGTDVQDVGNGAFNYMFSLNELVFNARQLNNNLGLTSINSLIRLSIGSEVQIIPDSFLSSCQNLTGTLSLPSTLERIGDNAFYYCGFSGELVLPSGLRELGNGAFGYCKFSSIKSLSSIPPIIDYAGYAPMIFFGCWDKPLYVPNGCKSVYSSAAGWSNFTDIREMGTGMDENENANHIISIINGQIVVDVITDYIPVSLYDVMGRCLERASGISKCVFSVPASGIYYVKIGNNPAQKVVVFQ